MEKYLMMSDVFFATVETKQLSGWKHQGRYVEIKKIQEYAAHAINSHDELVAMNKDLLAALEMMVNISSLDVVNSDESNIALSAANSAIAKAKAAS